jgi:hypothetical protein
MARDEWIAWLWIDVTELGNAERMYLRGLRRPIDGAEKAGKDFDAWQKATISAEKRSNKK